MVQGTASSVGKSLLTAALCRHFRLAGVDVAPFKAQNISLNAAVTADGREIGRAQAVQARACGLSPTVEMNPVLLKPEAGRGAQWVVRGRPLSASVARDEEARRAEVVRAIEESLASLRRRHALVLIEGAGSPAEVNLRGRDLSNMHVARLAGAPVLLVGDIERGGVFAALVGTLELLEPEDRNRVAALVVNRFRGDPALFGDGVCFLQERTGKPVLGVVPHVPDLHVADEDAAELPTRGRSSRPGAADVAVVQLPHISNYDDLLPLQREPGVRVRFEQRAVRLGDPDLLVLPGSKSTVADLGWLRESGWAAAVARHARRGGRVLGICGGCQMLGERIDDPEAVESQASHVEGLGLLPLRTRFEPRKNTARVRMRAAAPSWLTTGLPADCELGGYEIHMGRTRPTRRGAGAFVVTARSGEPVDATGEAAVDGASAGNVVGTMIHGLFEGEAMRAGLLRTLGVRPVSEGHADDALDAELDRLEGVVSAALDLPALWKLVGLQGP
jgi:adenosylcobyric acid synthase